MIVLSARFRGSLLRLIENVDRYSFHFFGMQNEQKKIETMDDVSNWISITGEIKAAMSMNELWDAACFRMKSFAIFFLFFFLSTILDGMVKT